MKLVFQKLNGSLLPADQDAEQALAKIAKGELVFVGIKKSRNIKHHRLYWALVGLVYDNQSTYQSKEVISDVLKISAGHADLVRLPNGGEYYRPRSISFAKMNQLEFSEFWDRICRYACEKLIPGIGERQLKNELYGMVDATGLLIDNEERKR